MIITNEKVQDATKRLEDMKQATLLNYLDNIDFDNNISWFNQMIVNFAQGNLNQYFSSSLFEKMSNGEKEKLLGLANEYVTLCFCEGNVLKWTESVENVVSDDYDFICLKIFDNFNFLIDVLKNGGKEVLDLLKEFQGCEEFSKRAVVESLRNAFVTDSVLKSILVKMTQKDSLYNLFTDQQKATLCNYPEGTLYTYDDKDLVKIISPIDLAIEINRRVTKYEEKDQEKLKVAIKKIPSFQGIVSEMSIEYAKKYGKALNDMMKFINEVENQPSKNYWNIDTTPLGDFVDSGSDKKK